MARDDLDRARLRSAWRVAGELGRADAEAVAGLPAELRALGLGQALAVQIRGGQRALATAIAARMREVAPELGAPAALVMDTFDAWVGLGDGRRALVIEEDLTAWAGDLKLMIALRARANDEVQPQGAQPREEAAMRAALDDPTLRGAVARCRSLPVDLRELGLLRTLGVLARERRGAASPALLASLHARLVQVYPDTPRRLGALVDALTAPGAQPAAWEAEALAWSVSLKTWLDVVDAGQREGVSP